jgi:hypothetical protein
MKIDRRPSTTIRHDPATAANFRLLDVGSTGRLRVIGIALRNGNPAGNGGGIRNAGRLVLNFVTVNDNLAGVALNAGGNGGGLANLAGAHAVVAHTVISANEALRALAETTTGNGGGIHNAGSLTLFESRLVANNATSTVGVAGTGSGGGIKTRATGTSLAIRSTLVDNRRQRSRRRLISHQRHPPGGDRLHPRRSVLVRRPQVQAAERHRQFEHRHQRGQERDLRRRRRWAADQQHGVRLRAVRRPPDHPEAAVGPVEDRPSIL